MQGIQEESSGADVVRGGRAAGVKGWTGRRDDDGGGEVLGGTKVIRSEAYIQRDTKEILTRY